MLKKSGQKRINSRAISVTTIILSVILIIILFLLVYVFKNIDIYTGKVKIFESKRANFQFKYPSYQPISIATDDDLVMLEKVGVEALRLEKSPERFVWNASLSDPGFIEVYEDKTIHNIDEFEKQRNESYEKLSPAWKKITPRPEIEHITIDGEEAIKIIDKDSELAFRMPHTTYILVKNNLIYDITFYPSFAENDAERVRWEEAYKMVLSSFKFTDNGILGFLFRPNSIKIPQKKQLPERCKILEGGSYKIEKMGNKVLFKDYLHGYEIDFTSIPDAHINRDPKCPDISYDIDMYKKIGELFPKSVARFKIILPEETPETTNLLDYAIKKLNYKEGSSDKGGSYDGPSFRSKATFGNLENDYKFMSWDTKDQGGSFLNRDYLIGVDNKLIHIYMFTWTDQSFTKSKKDFDKVVASFSINKNLVK